IALLGAGEVAGAGISHEKSIENDAIGSGENLGTEDVQASDTERAGDFAEEAGTVPGADFDCVVAAVELVVPINDRHEGGVLFRNLLAHETMSQQEVVDDVTSRMNLEIARWQSGEMGLEFFILEALGQ